MDSVMNNITPTLSALVYRRGKGCKQYAFAEIEELAQWAKRHPYRNEQVRVMPFSADRRKLADEWIDADRAAEWALAEIDQDRNKP